MSVARKLAPPWQKGQSGNPSGRPRIPDELRKISSLSNDEIVKLVSKYARMTKDQMEIAVRDESTPVIEVAIASIFTKSIQSGDWTRLEFLLNRIPKPKADPRDLEEESLRAFLQSLSEEEFRKLWREKTAELEAPKP